MKGKTALITGASRGIGLAISRSFSDAGARVIIPDRNLLDLRSNESIDQFLTSMQEDIDILVQNAGINILSTAMEVSDDTMAEMMQVNLIGPMRLQRGLIERMRDKQYGKIVNLSSVWSLVSKTKRFPYSIVKSGLNGMTRALAVELAPYNVLVNAVAPGYVNTELTMQNNSAQELEEIKKTIPIRRLAEPHEIAEVVSFLASSRNSYITGQIITVDGGFTCQ